MNEKCCGTCKWWTPVERVSKDADWTGKCQGPVPFCVRIIDRFNVYRFDGADCPCHTPKEPSDENQA